MSCFRRVWKERKKEKKFPWGNTAGGGEKIRGWEAEEEGEEGEEGREEEKEEGEGEEEG